jgi:hypothetical protein
MRNQEFLWAWGYLEGILANHVFKHDSVAHLHVGLLKGILTFTLLITRKDMLQTELLQSFPACFLQQ